MKLQFKILAVIIPFVLLSLVILGLWSFSEAQKSTYKSTNRYLFNVLESYTDEHIVKNYQLLKEAKLENVQSYVENYQQEAIRKSEEISKAKGGHIVIFNTTGKLVFCTMTHAGALMEKSWERTIREVVSQDRADIIHGKIEEGSFNDIYVARYFKPWEWVVFYAIADEEISHSLNKILLLTFTITVLCAFGGTILIFIFSRRYLVRPINVLRDAASKITSHKQIKTIAVDSKDELGMLARSMEEMSQSIYQYNADRQQAAKLLLEKQRELELSKQELKRHHDSLERLVHERTLELSEANKQLQKEIIVRKQEQEEKHELELMLQQSQKMESIGTLAGGIAHDFNNILSSVLGFTELALDAVEKRTPIEDDLQEVYAAGLRAKDLVQQILTFARQSDEELKPVQVGSIIKEVLKFIRSSLPTTIDIKQNLESDSLIMGNSTQIHRIMMNLCTNAAQAMENGGGTLEITIKDITIDRATMREKSHLKRGHYIEINVSDTGKGIDSKIFDKIFEPYFTTKELDKGTGMGLATVHGIVETYDGKIFVESTLGRGTIFTIYLPVAGQSKARQQYKVEELPTGQERILFVDDEPQIVKIASRILGQLGYSVTTKTNSVEALELFRSKLNDFDLVISDVTMPKMTGDQLTQKMIQIRPDIPVILCTGYSKIFSEEKASEIGIKAFVYKPIVKEDLAKTVRKVLDDTNIIVSAESS